MKFSELELNEKLLLNLKELGFENALDVQEKAIPKILENRDAIIRSKTGSGKTFTFLLPILTKMLFAQDKGIKTVILCPTRELAIQVKTECEKLVRGIEEIRVVAVYGGDSITKQIKLIKDRANIVIGTTGRVIDLIERRVLKLNSVNTLVLDEADVMLDMGFIKDIESILKYIPQSSQKLMFSATFPENIKQLASKILVEPAVVEIGIENKSLTEINEEFAIIKKINKDRALLKLLNDRNYFLSIVFCNTKEKTEELCSFLRKNKIIAKALNGDMSQFERSRVLTNFKQGLIAVLVATDVASRGLDICDVDCVFNYDIPKTIEYFLHRVGRTARAGKMGNAITFVCCESELEILKEIQEKTQTDFEKIDMEELNFYFYNTKKKSTVKPFNKSKTTKQHKKEHNKKTKRYF